ncbi:MAG: hypothetical protein ABSD46_11760 [Bacteroidota bacterium]
MKSIPKVLLLPVLVCLASGVFYNTASTQVTTVISLSEYDVIFLTDFFDVKTDKLSSNSPGFSVKIDGLPIKEEIYLNVKVNAQLRGGNGDAGQAPLVEGCTNNIISTTGSLVLSASDFAKGGIASLNDIRCGGYKQNEPLKKKIRDLALSTSTAPPGTYQIMINVFRASDNTPLGRSSLGTINVAYATPDEVFVEINDPRNGSYSNNLAPTFSWTSAAPNVTVRVYEAGLNHRSPQDALTGGNPYLEENVVGTNTLTYPANAKRQLQENKAYVLQIEANVSSSRGPMKSVSQPVVFRITNDNLGSILDYFLNSVSGNASATYSTLRAEPTKWIPWSPYGNITLNGNMLSESDLQVLLNELSTQQDVKLELSVENQ